MQVLSGKEVVAAMNELVGAKSAALRARGVVPTLAVVRVGERAGDIFYERGAMKRCAATGIEVKSFVLPETATQEELMRVIAQVNADVSIHGCLMFRPLPAHMDEAAACRALDPAKDVDGITDGSLAGVFADAPIGFPPCTARACIEMLDHYQIDLAGKRVVVVGRSLVIGKPVAMMLLKKNATVTICHSKTRDLPSVCREADVIVAAIGRARMLDGSYFSAGQTVIDVGVNADKDGGMCGDVLYDDATRIVAAVTPVPGGVGTVTTSVLTAHTVEAAERLTR